MSTSFTETMITQFRNRQIIKKKHPVFTSQKTTYSYINYLQSKV